MSISLKMQAKMASLICNELTESLCCSIDPCRRGALPSTTLEEDLIFLQGFRLFFLLLKQNKGREKSLLLIVGFSLAVTEWKLGKTEGCSTSFVIILDGNV